MTRRRRIARLLDHLGRVLFGPYAQAWASIPQDAIDDLIDRTEASEALRATHPSGPTTGQVR